MEYYTILTSCFKKNWKENKKRKIKSQSHNQIPQTKKSKNCINFLLILSISITTRVYSKQTIFLPLNNSFATPFTVSSNFLVIDKSHDSQCINNVIVIYQDRLFNDTAVDNRYIYTYINTYISNKRALKTVGKNTRDF